jgi:hypothetical protein
LQDYVPFPLEHPWVEWNENKVTLHSTIITSSRSVKENLEKVNWDIGSEYVERQRKQYLNRDSINVKMSILLSLFVCITNHNLPVC